ncbi:hypothetical protein WJX72_007785 [[Myrmecia] bisecta]|uniref:F-box domain-containing protein n=1 Tax=[Myrmecia] bisecta TaxID=41462 RepID=A0AAW1Q4C2_9CHLO
MAQTTPRGPTILALPVEAINLIFLKLEMKVRTAVLPLVCKTWNKALQQLGLWPDLGVDLAALVCKPASPKSFCGWLATRATAVQNVRLVFDGRYVKTNIGGSYTWLNMVAASTLADCLHVLEMSRLKQLTFHATCDEGHIQLLIGRLHLLANLEDLIISSVCWEGAF